MVILALEPGCSSIIAWSRAEMTCPCPTENTRGSISLVSIKGLVVVVAPSQVDALMSRVTRELGWMLPPCPGLSTSTEKPLDMRSSKASSERMLKGRPPPLPPLEEEEDLDSMEEGGVLLGPCIMAEKVAVEEEGVCC